MNHKQVLGDLCDLEIANSIQISPNGKQVVYSTQLTWGHYKGKYATSSIWLASTSEEKSSHRITSGLYHDSAPAWHPNGKSIAFLSDRAKAGEKWAIYMQDFHSDKEAIPITPSENESVITLFSFSPNGQYIAFISTDELTEEEKRHVKDGEDVMVWGQHWRHARLRIVNIKNRKVKSLSLDCHAVDLCWSPNGEQLGIVICKTPDLEEPFVTGSTISIVNLELTQTKNICQFPSKIGNLAWANDGKLYFYSGSPEGTLFHGYGAYVVDTKSRSYTSAGFGKENDVCGIKLLKGKVLVQLKHRLESRISFLSGQVLYERKEDLEAFDAVVLPDNDEILMVVATSSVNHPIEVYMTNPSSKVLLQLSDHGYQFKGRKFGHCSYLTFPSSDGKVEVDSIYLTPNDEISDAGDKPTQPLSTIVLIHGGPNERVINAFNTYYYMITPYLLSLGYGILLPNYRGSSGRGEEFGRYSIGGAGVYDYADIIGSTQNAINLGYADKGNLLICGWSQGGFLTLLCSVRNGLHGNGWKFKASIPGASICDIDSMALTSDFANCFEPEIHQGRVIWNMDRQDIRNRSASALWEFHQSVEKSKEIKEMIVPPMLILHGQEDARCHVSNAWAMRRALQSQTLPFELVIYPRQKHFFHEQKFWIDMVTRIERWCRIYIGKVEE